jgi:NAD(P)-dependent dehydrogenase (short-subunit alcohol dehydrogenase family)
MSIGVNDVNANLAESVVAELRAKGCQAISLVASVADKNQVNAMINIAEEELGPVWLLVNNAGVVTISALRLTSAKRPGTRSLTWMPKASFFVPRLPSVR